MSDLNWTEIPIPSDLSPGPGGQIMHYFKADDRWAVYMMEISVEGEDDSNAMILDPMGPAINGRAKWHITFDSKVVASGHLGSASSAKNVSMTVLHALMEGPAPDAVEETNFMMTGGPVN